MCVGERGGRMNEAPTITFSLLTLFILIFFLQVWIDTFNWFSFFKFEFISWPLVGVNLTYFIFPKFMRLGSMLCLIVTPTSSKGENYSMMISMR